MSVISSKNLLELTEPTTPRYPKIYSDLVYATKEHQSLTLTLMTPPVLPNTKPHFPLIVWVPDLDETGTLRPDARFAQLLTLTTRGYAVALVSYHLDDQTQMVKDIHSATRFLLDHSFKYHLDPYRYLLFGKGQGADLSALSIFNQGQQSFNDEDVRRSQLRYQGAILLAPRTPDQLVTATTTTPKKLPPFLLLEAKQENVSLAELADALTSLQPKTARYCFNEAMRTSDAFFTPYSLDLLFDFISASFAKK